jgi:hypothetical protein
MMPTISPPSVRRPRSARGRGNTLAFERGNAVSPTETGGRNPRLSTTVDGGGGGTARLRFGGAPLFSSRSGASALGARRVRFFVAAAATLSIAG